jgi:drug/metabolite transporter (DMT)-like permease
MAICRPEPSLLLLDVCSARIWFMSIALLFAAPIFARKTERAIKWLFIANGIVGIAFLNGNALELFTVNILACFVLGVLFPIAAILIAKKFRNYQEN